MKVKIYKNKVNDSFYDNDAALNEGMQIIESGSESGNHWIDNIDDALKLTLEEFHKSPAYIPYEN